MRRLAELPAPLRYLVIALLLCAFIVLLHWLEEEPAVHHGGSPLVSIHVKLRPGAHALARSQPLFTHVRHAAAGDPRLQWERLEVPADRVHDTLANLARDPQVEEAFVAPGVSLPDVAPRAADDRCPIHTPSFESYQGYLGPAPHGIDAPAAWRLGVRGAGEQFADIEGGWNAAHEDLPGARIVHAGGRPIPDASWRAHGTAVLGEVVAADNGKGVVGIAPDVERIYTSSIGGTAVADAIDVAAERLGAGDVLLIELQGLGPRGRFLPMEYWDDNYDAYRVATSRGVVVIEAAGNGAEDLDDPAYRGKLSRGTRGSRDSGAIVVGAGAPPRQGFDDRVRLDFSNYGSRVDVQGWGRKVATLDYGDLQRCAGADRHYTGEFAGTSSASPIVAGTAVLIESYARAHGGVLSPTELRGLLVATGTPQAGDAAGEPIGPRPDLARALAKLEARTAVPRYCYHMRIDPKTHRRLGCVPVLCSARPRSR